MRQPLLAAPAFTTAMATPSLNIDDFGESHHHQCWWSRQPPPPPVFMGTAVTVYQLPNYIPSLSDISPSSLTSGDPLSDLCGPSLRHLSTLSPTSLNILLTLSPPSLYFVANHHHLQPLRPRRWPPLLVYLISLFIMYLFLEYSYSFQVPLQMWDDNRM